MMYSVKGIHIEGDSVIHVRDLAGRPRPGCEGEGFVRRGLKARLRKGGMDE
jgi:hypothetical protein